MRKTKLVLFIDWIEIFLAIILGYALRFSMTAFPEKGIAPIQPYVYFAVIAASVWVCLFYLNKLYDEKGFFNPCFEFGKIVQASFFAAVIISAGTFFYRSFLYSRIAVCLGIAISFILLSVSHIFLSRLFASAERIIYLVGDPAHFSAIAKRLQLHGRRVHLHFVSHENFSAELSRLSEKERNQTIVIASPDGLEKLQGIEHACNLKGVRFYILPGAQQIFLSGGRVEEIDGMPVITSSYMPLESPFNRAVKRLIDIVFSMLFLIATLPLFVLFAILIKLNSSGPVFYTQERVGFRRRIFKIFKFRTMKKVPGFVLPYTIPDDPRLTTTGRFLRRFNLDELPQLFNVLRGDMSIVGPRPISIEDKLFFSVPGFYERLSVLPGMTGWAQVHGLRGGQVEPEERFRYDLYYAENWSIWLDFAIICFTCFSFIGYRKRG
jgi:exopolysaccharide biosynthesis polyprenyl glycosylphosphotransferase